MISLDSPESLQIHFETAHADSEPTSGVRIMHFNSQDAFHSMKNSSLNFRMLPVLIETTFFLNFWKRGQPSKITCTPKFSENSYREFSVHLTFLLEFWDFWLNGSLSENWTVSEFSGNFPKKYLDYACLPILKFSKLLVSVRMDSIHCLESTSIHHQHVFWASKTGLLQSVFPDWSIDALGLLCNLWKVLFGKFDRVVLNAAMGNYNKTRLNNIKSSQLVFGQLFSLDR